MKQQKLKLRVSLFGKHPSNSEYLYLGEQSAFVYSILQWIKDGYEAFLKSRLVYHEGRVHNFYFFNHISNSFVCGSMKLSRDSKGRFYPLLIFVEIPSSLSIQLNPLIVKSNQIWQKISNIFNKKLTLEELKQSIDTLNKIDEVVCHAPFDSIEKRVLGAFFSEDFSQKKLFYETLNIDDFINLMR